jgi:nucleoside-diphosphate-sugar epimerase
VKILLSGATGFLGNNMNLKSGQNQLIRIGKNKLNDIVIDLSINIPELAAFDLIIHAAGKAHGISKTKEDIEDFYKSNVQATINLIKGLDNQLKKPNSFVYISSVAVYGVSSGNLLNEDNLLLADDPYGKSKIQAEKYISDWCNKNNVTCTILRLPLLLGNDPKGNLAAMISGINKGFYFNINKGQAKKSMLMASDVAGFILNFHNVGGTYNLTDGYHPSFNELSCCIAQQLGNKRILNMPLFFAKGLSKIGDVFGSKFPINSYKLDKITSTLTFDDSKARSLGWRSTLVLDAFKI